MSRDPIIDPSTATFGGDENGDDPYAPSQWGIDPATAREIMRFDDKGLPQISLGRFGDTWPSRTLTARIPDIEEVARLADHGNWYWETRPPHPVFRRIEGVDSPRLNAWTADDDAIFAANWNPDLDPIVDEFIDVYGSAWPTAISVAAPESNPVTRFVHDLIASDAISIRPRKGYDLEGLSKYKLANALDTGPFNVTVARRTWTFPTIRSCACCGADHYYDLARYHLIRVFGGPGICAPCMWGARYGDSRSTRSRSQILGALRDFSDLTNTIPARTFRESVYTAAMSSDDRGMAIALLMSIPDSADVLDVTNSSNWLQVLHAAGIVGPEGWRPGRGTICLANDGHYCRSLAEKAICDWLYTHGVSHVTEPPWPRHRELNPSGKLRADWAIGDMYVEFAGMMGEEQYREKIGKKVKLAAEVGIELIVLQPEDLPRLAATLGRALSIPDEPNSDIRDTPPAIVSPMQVRENSRPPSSLDMATTPTITQGRPSMDGDMESTYTSRPAKSTSDAGFTHSAPQPEPQLVVSIAESADTDGNIAVQILNPAGAVVHEAKFNRDDTGHRVDLTFDYASPSTGAYEVRIAIRPVAQRPIEEAADDYGYDDYH